MSDADGASEPEVCAGEQDAEVAAAIVDLQMQQVAYEASLGTTAQVIQPSLRDFLR